MTDLAKRFLLLSRPPPACEQPEHEADPIEVVPDFLPAADGFEEVFLFLRISYTGNALP